MALKLCSSFSSVILCRFNCKFEILNLIVIRSCLADQQIIQICFLLNASELICSHLQYCSFLSFCVICCCNIFIIAEEIYEFDSKSSATAWIWRSFVFLVLSQSCCVYGLVSFSLSLSYVAFLFCYLLHDSSEYLFLVIWSQCPLKYFI